MISATTRNHSSIGSSPPTLASTVAAMDGREDPDVAVRKLSILWDGHGPVISPAYLEPISPSQRLQRGPASLLLDTAARSCVDAMGLGTRLAVIAAHRIRSQLAFQRLGYRSDADYAREELGMTPRAFRDKARLGARLERLPAVREAFIERRITYAQAEVVARIATEADEAEWLARAAAGTVRELKAAARRARQRMAEEKAGASVSETAETSAPEAIDESETPRKRRAFEVPAELLGKIDIALQLAERVAGAPLPPGTLWELIAADYLSGAPAGPAARGQQDERAAARRGTTPTPAKGNVPPNPPIPEPEPELEPVPVPVPVPVPEPGPFCSRPRHPPEDPRGYQVWLEHESRRWRWLPSARPSLELHGQAKQLRRRCVDDGTRSAWELHRDLTAGLAAERRVAWQLGRLLSTVRNRRLWRDMWFASFSHYVRERLGISVRTAERLIRIDREAWSYPPLRRAWENGELSPLLADALVRVLRYVADDEETQQAWIDYAKRTTFEHLGGLIRAAERSRAEMAPARRRPFGRPEAVERALFDTDEVRRGLARHDDSGLPRRDEVGGSGARPPMFVSARYAVWMTDDEFEVLRRAMETIKEQLARGPGRKIPDFACLEALLDEFLRSYDELSRSMREAYPLFERDGWRCRVPGCSAYGPLHLHHITFRSHGGGDEPENLITLCDLCRYRHKSHYAEHRIIPRRAA